MVGENIIFLRKRNGMTQEALSERINVSRQTVAKWERGESEPDCSSLMRLSTLFNLLLNARRVALRSLGQFPDPWVVCYK